MPSEPIPDEVLRAYGLEDARVTPVSVGWINRTLRVERAGEPYILQRLHPIFAAEVNDDIDAVTTHLAARGVPTPRLVRTGLGARSVDAEGTWRMLTHVDGETLAAMPTSAHARAAGAFVARFHRSLDDLSHDFAFSRPGVHDVEAHVAKLRVLRSSDLGFSARAEADGISDAILEAARALPALDRGPRRIIHGDLKVTNLLFAEGPRVAAIVDLDTLAHGSVAIDLGDALRSWCNPSDEADPGAALDVRMFEAAMRGYLDGAGGWLTEEERSAIVPALETICLELASRFAADLYEDTYFGYDASRFPSRRAHNLARARAQLSLGLDVRRRRDELAQLSGGEP